MMPAPANRGIFFALLVLARLAIPSSAVADPIQYGRKLFESTALSSDGKISCRSCHSPENGFADKLAISVGAHLRRGNRNTPGILMGRRQTSFGWDGSSPTLSDVIRKALVNKNEMDANPSNVAKTLSLLGHRGDRLKADPITEASLLISQYLESLPPQRAQVDSYLIDRCHDSLSEMQKRGLKLFFGKAHCSVCHTVSHPISHPFGGSSLLFTDERFHNLGLVSDPVGNGPRIKKARDFGREIVSGRRADRGLFRTPTLRNVGLTAPYMHDGRFGSLEQVVNFYNAGGGNGPGKDLIMKPLFLTGREKHDLVQFLASLTECSANPENSECVIDMSCRKGR